MTIMVSKIWAGKYYSFIPIQYFVVIWKNTLNTDTPGLDTKEKPSTIQNNIACKATYPNIIAIPGHWCDHQVRLVMVNAEK